MYNPHREQSIDEAMVKYKGRVKFLQYMPMKPCKRGIKFGVVVIRTMATSASLKFTREKTTRMKIKHQLGKVRRKHRSRV